MTTYLEHHQFVVVSDFFPVVFMLLERRFVAWQPTQTELRVWFGNYLSSTTRYTHPQSRRAEKYTSTQMYIITLYTFAWQLARKSGRGKAGKRVGTGVLAGNNQCKTL